jgi:hypothetical protein
VFIAFQHPDGSHSSHKLSMHVPLHAITIKFAYHQKLSLDIGNIKNDPHTHMPNPRRQHFFNGMEQSIYPALGTNMWGWGVCDKPFYCLQNP